MYYDYVDRVYMDSIVHDIVMIVDAIVICVQD